jgi:hypothetical protein
MPIVPQPYRSGFKFFCDITKRHYGPFFKSMEAIKSFSDWFDGDVRYVQTSVDPRTWEMVMIEWLNSESGSVYVMDNN